jgi:hypothetical protein
LTGPLAAAAADETPYRTFPDGSRAHLLAMELVEGEDLAERLGRGPEPVEDAIPIAKQMAEALEEATRRASSTGT